MRHLRLLLLGAGFFSLTMSLSAQELFNWGYTSGNENAAQGTLTADLIHGSLTGEGEYQVVSMTGTWDETTIMGPSTVYGADNLFNYNGTSGAFTISSNGIGFSAGDSQVSFTGPVSGFPDGSEDANGSISTLDSVRLSEPPTTNAAPWEPSDLLAVSACAGLAFQQLRRRSKSRFVKS